MKGDFSKAKRVVVKLGTNIIIKNNKFNRSLINDLAKQISSIRRTGVQFILITSGAIGMGIERMHLNHKGLDVVSQQATSAVGQNLLMNEYERAFSKYNQIIGQILLTQSDFTNKKSLNNLKHTIDKLLKLNVIPIINENDPVGTEELRTTKGFSDNDMLAASVASNFNADSLIILTDVEGLYTADPKKKKEATLIKCLEDLKKYEVLLGGPSLRGLGGFRTKVDAAKKACSLGITSIICKGKRNVLEEIFAGKCTGTVFYAKE